MNGEPMRIRVVLGLGAIVATAGLIAAAPATPSYIAVEKAIRRIETDWETIPPDRNPHAESWRTLFGLIRQDLQAYSKSEKADDRLDALRRLYDIGESLAPTSWPAAAELREELRHWLRPRMALAWAEYRALEAANAGDSQLRDQWQGFIQDRLRPALLAVESAGSVNDRVKAVEHLHETIDEGHAQIDGSPLAQSASLMLALKNLYNTPNVELTLDRSAVTNAIMPNGIVDAGPIFFKGQWSYVTPGPVTGIGFVPTANGIHIAISQALTSITPVIGFQDRIAADAQGQRAAKMYEFSATTRNDAILTMYVMFRLAGGLHLMPTYQHGVSASICSTPASGGGVQRLFGSLLGFGQQKITNLVYTNAISEMRREVPAGADELGQIKSGERQAQLNAQIAPYIPDSRTLASGEIGLTDLSLQTYPNYARAEGRVFASDRANARGALMPQPRRLETYEPGITADVHLPSALDSVISWLYNGQNVQDAQNVVLEPSPPAVEGTPASSMPKVETNVDYAGFLSRLDTKRAESEGRLPTLIRLKRPERPPVVSTDAQGHLVLLVSDLQLDLPAPPGAARGGGITGPPARVYQLRSPLAEIVLNIQVETDPAGGPPRLAARVVDFDPGPNAKVFAANEDEATAVALNPLTSRVIMGLLETRLSAQPINVPLAALGQQGVYLQSASELDPTGWMRLILQPR